MFGLDLLSLAFFSLPMVSHALSIYLFPSEDLAGVMVGLLILASMSFTSHLFFLAVAFAGVGLMVFTSYSAGIELPKGFWMSILFVAPGIAFITRVVIQKNYDLLLERLNSETQLSAKLAATADALKTSMRDQEQSQLELKQSDLQLSTVLGNAPIVLCVLDREGVYTQSRGHGLGQLGLQEGEMVGKQFAELYKDHPSVLAAFTKAQQGESSQVRVSFSPGVTHEIQYCPVFGEDQKLAGVVGVGLDVSQSVLDERQKLDLESQLFQAQKMESLGLLASGVAHDFNNYLGAIIAFCESMDGQPADDTRDIPAEIKKVATSAAGVCEQMLVFAGKSTHEKSSVDLNSLVGETKQFFRAIVSNEIVLDFELAPYSVFINANRLLIQQAIVNLIKNASESINVESKQGRILVSTRVVDSLSAESLTGIQVGELDPSAAQEAFALLTIQDNGSGIEAADLERVFEPYFSNKSKSNGHGFGLAITAGVVKNHNGMIYCDSDSSGTRIDLAFPVCKSTETPISQGLSTQNLNVDAVERILLVDDEVMITQSVGLVLEGFGFKITTANSGSNALKLIDAGEEFDCVIVDYSMPEMNGLEFLSELNDRQIKTPSIMCSGYLELPEDGKNLPHATLRKPYSIEKLQETIGEVCSTEREKLMKSAR